MRKVLPVGVILLSGCAIYAPSVPEAELGLPDAWPVAEAAGEAAVVDVPWRDFFADENLKSLIAAALDANRDLRVAILDVERARSLYRIQRADRVPSLGVTAAMTRVGSDNQPVDEAYTVDLGAAFELDLFGRVRNLSRAALEQYLATEEAQRAFELALISDVAGAYLTLAADRELLRIANAALATHEETLGLTNRRYELGAVSALDLARARTIVETARADAARYAGQVAQDENALRLLVGAPVDDTLLPDAFDPQVSGLAPLPAGVPSDVLLRRPDVRAAERRLRAASANVGAARAAFFPSISLTGSVGTASPDLGGLFESGSFGWRFVPSIDLPIFQAGRLRGNLGVANADRDIALARYERAIQAAFRDTADALVLTRTLTEQHAAQRALLDAANRVYELSKARYDAGQDSYLSLLDAQRTLYSAQQGLVGVQLAEQFNRVSLYRALAGGWSN
ncbi:MAG: efflux transporter outer membrane subunit [Gammaproteobacteria bacterium]